MQNTRYLNCQQTTLLREDNHGSRKCGFARDSQERNNQPSEIRAITSFREELGISQRDASLGIGYANATFVCNVEKGQNNIPINKVLDFASQYSPVEKSMMAAAILRYVLPDVWEACSEIFPGMLKSNMSKQELTKLVDDWTESKFIQHQVTF